MLSVDKSGTGSTGGMHARRRGRERLAKKGERVGESKLISLFPSPLKKKNK